MIAAELGVLCNRAGKLAHPPAGWAPSLAFCPDEWEYAFHYSLGFTRAAWRRWSRMPLWPRDGLRDAVPSLRPLWAVVNGSDVGGVDAKARLELNALRSRLNIGLEVLSGALLASINERRRCNLNGPKWYSTSSMLDKGHGSTHSNATLERCTADGVEHSWAWVNRFSGLTRTHH